MTLNEIVNNFIANINEEYTAIEGTCFEVDFMEYVINYTANNEADNFSADFMARFPVATGLNPFTLSLLHEVGHLETEDEIIDDTEERNAITDPAEYFNLWNEVIATEWAGYFIEDNFDEVAEFDQAIAELMGA